MRTIRQILVLVAALGMAGCSFEVTNPGPVADDALNDPGAFDAIVRGVRYNLSRAYGINTFYGAVAAKADIVAPAARVVGRHIGVDLVAFDLQIVAQTEGQIGVVFDEHNTGHGGSRIAMLPTCRRRRAAPAGRHCA